MRRTLNAIILVSFLIAALAGCGGGGGGGGGGNDTADVSLNSTVVSIAPSGTYDFSANIPVTWTVTGGNANGTVSPTTGTNTRYTAPNTSGTYTIVATSMADPTKSATAQIHVEAVPTAVIVTPDGASPSPGGTVQFHANVSVDWTVQEGATGGTISTSGLYKAPNAVGLYHVVATSKVDHTKKAVVPVRVEDIVNPPPPPL